MKRYPVIVLLLLLLLAVAGCNTPSLSQAQDHHKRGEYFAAGEMYRRVYNKTPAKNRPLRGLVAFNVGECYRLLGQSARSASAYANAIRYNYPDSTAHLHYAQMLHREGKLLEAERQYNLFLEKCPHSELAYNGLLGCDFARKAKASPNRYIVKRANLFNSSRGEFSPMFFTKEADQLYFSTSNEKVLGSTKSQITGMKSNDIFVARKNEKKEWIRPEPVEGGVNTEMDEGTPSFTSDATTMYLSVAKDNPNGPSSVAIYSSRRTGAQWSEATQVELSTDTFSLFAHPAVSPDGLFLYFTSDMPGGYGGKDIYRMPLNVKGDLVFPENLGPSINTPGDEVFPYMRDDSTFYFASNGHVGMGGLDLFVATPAGNESWEVKNLGPPINSPADDFGITFGKEESGFFSSNRNDARGYDHLFSFILPSLQVWISGQVVDVDEDPIESAAVHIVGKDGTNQKIPVKRNGTYKVKLDRGTEYVMMSSARGYLNRKEELVTAPAEKDASYKINFMLQSMTQPVLIDNIIYEFNKATLTAQSSTALLQLVEMLIDNPNITIELAAHTDMKGNENYNLDLSLRRAQSVVDYLIAYGISPDRLTPVGYGKERPVRVTRKMVAKYPFLREDQLLEEEYILTLPLQEQEIANQINRRTEFSVQRINYRLY